MDRFRPQFAKRIGIDPDVRELHDAIRLFTCGTQASEALVAAVPPTPERSGFCPFPRALHTEDVLLKTRLRQGLPLARLGAAERERAQAVVADGLLLSDGDRLVLTDRPSV